MRAVFHAALTRPWKFCRALAATLQAGRRSRRGRWRHVIYLAEACVLRAWLERAGVSHLHAHFGTNPATVALLCRLLGGPPFSFTVHGPEEFDAPESLNLGRKIKHAAFVAAVSSYGRSQLMRWCRHEDWSKLHVVHCGLDRDLLDRVPMALTDAPRFVCLGRLCEQKGQLLLVEAARRLDQQGVRFELVLVGDGELRKPLDHLIEQYGLTDRIKITGWQSGDQVMQWIDSARALVLPSFAEGLPVAIMEALALGRPVISTYVAGIPELVNRQCGLLIPAGSVDHLVEAMRVTTEASTRELARMGEVGADRVRKRHDVRIEAGKLATLFADGVPEGFEDKEPDSGNDP